MRVAILNVFFIKKKAFQHYKRIKYGSRFVSILLTTGGVASMIASGGVLGILAVIPGIVIETIMDDKNINNNNNNMLSICFSKLPTFNDSDQNCFEIRAI